MAFSKATRTLAVFGKDVRSEFKTRYGISAVALFVLSSLAAALFAIGDVRLSAQAYAALLWIIMFFGLTTGLSKSFVSEEERQTSLYLKITATNGAVYFGKLLFNIILAISINTLSALLFLLFFSDFQIASVGSFVLSIYLGGAGIASVATIISAIVAQARAKSSLFAVLAFPAILPVILIGVETTLAACEGVELSSIYTDFLFIAFYSGAIISISYVLFDIVWD